MLLLLFFMVLNTILSFVANYIMHLSALDIAPVAAIIIAWEGGNIALGSLLVVLAYATVHPSEFRFIWITLPMAIFAGHMALHVESAALILLVYHLIGFISAFFLGYFRGKYVFFMVINFVANYFVAKVYYFVA